MDSMHSMKPLADKAQAEVQKREEDLFKQLQIPHGIGATKTLNVPKQGAQAKHESAKYDDMRLASDEAKKLRRALAATEPQVQPPKTMPLHPATPPSMGAHAPTTAVHRPVSMTERESPLSLDASRHGKTFKSAKYEEPSPYSFERAKAPQPKAEEYDFTKAMHPAHFDLTAALQKEHYKAVSPMQYIPPVVKQPYEHKAEQLSITSPQQIGAPVAPQ